MKSKIKTVEQAFKYRKIDPKALPDVSMLPERHQKYIVAQYKLAIVAEALNQEANQGKEWQPNWNDTDEWKYWAYARIEASEEKPAGFGFSYAYYVNWDTGANVGSRLCFKSSELAKYAITQFEELYRDVFLIP